MDKVIMALNYIIDQVGGEWRKNLLIDEGDNSKEAKAYNEGVKAMSETVSSYLNAIMYGITFNSSKEGDS